MNQEPGIYLLDWRITWALLLLVIVGLCAAYYVVRYFWR